MPAPALEELAALAARAAGLLSVEGQATALWERRLRPDGVTETLEVAFTCVGGGRAARVVADGTADGALRRAAKAASLRAAQARAWPSGGLPDPGAPALPHAGFDPALLTIDPADLADRLSAPARWHAAATRIAIASTRGVRASEERSYVATPFGACHSLSPPQAGTCHLLSDLQSSDRYLVASAQSSDRHLVASAHGSTWPLVLGPVAVAGVLDRLRAALGVDLALGHGPLAGRIGERVAAPGVTLVDDSRHPLTLPRSYDAEGVPRERVVLIEDGVARGGVRDTASPQRTTGHATQAATLAPMPDHLVLAPGNAAGLDDLAAGVDRGLCLMRLDGPALAIADGAITDQAVEPAPQLDPLEILARVDALTRDRQTVALRSHAPGGSGAAVVPALRAR